MTEVDSSSFRKNRWNEKWWPPESNSYGQKPCAITALEKRFKRIRLPGASSSAAAVGTDFSDRSLEIFQRLKHGVGVAQILEYEVGA